MFIVKDCDPSKGPPCFAHSDVSASIFETPDECCGTRLGWRDLDECVADSTDDSLPLSGMWYVLWGGSTGDDRCVNECDGPDELCGGKADDYKELYETFKECCERHTWFNTDCTADVPTPDGGGISTSDSGGGALSVSTSPRYSNKYFANYLDANCLRDCETGTSFGCAPVPPNAILYMSIETCCKLGQKWVDISYCSSRSVGAYSEGWFVDYTPGTREQCGEYSCSKILLLTYSRSHSQILLHLFLVRDCDPAKGPPCHATDPGATLFATPEECCELISWNPTCVADSQRGGRRLTEYSLGLELSETLSDKWYYRKDKKGVEKCFKECEAGTEANCGGAGAVYKARYDTYQECCEWHFGKAVDECIQNVENGFRKKNLRGAELLQKKQ